MDVLVVRAHHFGGSQLLQRRRVTDDMVNDGRADLPGEPPDIGVRASTHGQRQQLVVGRKVLRSKPADVLRIFDSWTYTLRVGEQRPASRLGEAIDAGVGMLRRVRHL